MKKIITSLGVIVFVGAIIVGGTGAFFSDTETSTGNVFTAGAIDLQIDNTSYGFDWNDPTDTSPEGIWGLNQANSWTLTDLDDELFFNFADLKPGDYGEDTISLHVSNNSAYACMAFDLTGTPENGQNEPEAAVDATSGVNDGELQNYLSFLFWMDDGDNILEVGETVVDDLSGLSSDIFIGNWLAIAEGGDTPLPAGETKYLGKGWCFGDIAAAPVAQDGVNTSQPTANNTGFSCTGADGDHNDAQTDGLTVDVSFYAVQSRNNADFECSSLNPVVEPIWTDEGTRTGGDVSFIEDGEKGTVLQLTTIDDTDSRVRWNNDNFDIDLSTFTGISYDSKQVSANDAVNGNATLRLLIDLDGDVNTADVEEITYEPYYNIFAHNPLNAPSIVSNIWQSWQATLADGKFWGNGGFLGTTPSGGAYATNITLQQVIDVHPNAKIVGLSLGMGTYNVNQVVLVDDLIVNGTPVSLEN